MISPNLLHQSRDRLYKLLSALILLYFILQPAVSFANPSCQDLFSPAFDALKPYLRPQHENLVSFQSAEGRSRLNRAESTNTSQIYELVEYFEPQMNPLYCGVASAVIMLNAVLTPHELVPSQSPLEVSYSTKDGRGRIPYSRFSQSTFLRMVPFLRDSEFAHWAGEALTNHQSEEFGIHLDDFTKSLVTFGVSAETVFAHETDIDGLNSFRKRVSQSMEHKNEFIVAQFAAAALGFRSSPRTGHYSPIAAYDLATDSVLILDVAQHRSSWFWVPISDLYKSMQLKDGPLPRGYVIVRRKEVDPDLHRQKLVSDFDPDVPHTINKIPEYLNANMGSKTIELARDRNLKFEIHIGDGKEVIQALTASGWKIIERIVNPQGFHEVFHAISPTGEERILITRVNGKDRLTHVETLLKMMGISKDRVQIRGRIKSWGPRYDKLFKKYPKPDAVFIGGTFSIENIVTLKGHTISRQIAVPKPASDSSGRGDLDGMTLKIIELNNGKRIWVLNNLYGDIIFDLVASLEKLSIPIMVYTGTAGATSADFKVGELVSPVADLSGGTEEGLGWLAKLPSVTNKGSYKHVSTPNLENRNWLYRTIEQKVDIVEVELKYLFSILKRRPDIKTYVALLISDVVVGSNHSDYTEWGSQQQISEFKARIKRVMLEVMNFNVESDLDAREIIKVPL